MVTMRAQPFDRLTPSQEAVYSFVSNSSRWLTAYEISMLTGVSEVLTKSAVRELLQMGQITSRKRIYGFENGELEFQRVSPRLVAGMCAAASRRNHADITGVEPLARRLRRILGKDKARQYAEFLK